MEPNYLYEEAHALPGAFSQYDMMALYPALQTIPKDGVYLEVGVKNGRSLLFARKFSKGAVYGIDVNHELHTDAFKDYENWYFIHAASNDAVKDWMLPIDVLFIDGDHSYEGIKDDWDNFSRFVKPGGYVLFHDCDETSPGVQRLFAEIGDGWTDKVLCRSLLDDRNTSVASVRKA